MSVERYRRVERKLEISQLGGLPGNIVLVKLRRFSASRKHAVARGCMERFRSNGVGERKHLPILSGRLVALTKMSRPPCCYCGAGPFSREGVVTFDDLC